MLKVTKIGKVGNVQAVCECGWSSKPGTREDAYSAMISHLIDHRTQERLSHE